MKNIFIILALVFCSFQVRGQIFLSEIQDTVAKGYFPITDYDPALNTYIQKYHLLQNYLRDTIDWGVVAIPYDDVLTFANIGSGANVFKQVTGADIVQFRSLIGGTGIDATENASDITLFTDFTELTTETTVDGTDYVVIHDATSPNDGKITVTNFISSSGISTTDDQTLSEVLTEGNDAGGLGAVNFGNSAFGTSSTSGKLLVQGGITSGDIAGHFRGGNGGATVGLIADGDSDATDVLFKARSAADALPTDTGIKFIIMGDGKVGINNSAPSYLLDVGGTANVTGFRMTTGASNGYALVSDAVGVGTWTSLASYLDNTDDQAISIDSTALASGNQYYDITLEDGGSPIRVVDTDNQDLSLSVNTLSLTNDATSVDLSGYLDNTDTQDLSIDSSGLSFTISLVDGGFVKFEDSVDDADADATNEYNTNVALVGNDLQVTDGGGTLSTSLAVYLDNTDDQAISIDSTTLSNGDEYYDITLEDGGSSVRVVNTDRQDLSLTANTLSLTNDATAVDLSGYLDNTDAQTLSFVSPNLSISGGNSVDISAIDTDTQLSQEQVEDYAGAMFTGNTETLITSTYDDPTGKVTLTVNSDLSLYNNATSGFITTSDIWQESAGVISNINASDLNYGSNTFFVDVSTNNVSMLHTVPSVDFHLKYSSSFGSVASFPAIRAENTNTTGFSFTALQATSNDVSTTVLSSGGTSHAGITQSEKAGSIGTGTNHPFWLYSNNTGRLKIGTDGSVRFYNYGLGTFTGTLAYLYGEDSSGNLIEVAENTLSITESQISDLGAYAEQLSDLSDVNTSTPTNRNVLVADGVDWESRALATDDIQSGTFADARISQSSVTQHQAALTITESQISDLQSYILTSDVWGDDGTTITPDNVRNLNFDSGTFFIDQASNEVGIGTTSPSAKLDVVGEFQLFNASVGINKVLVDSDGSGNTTFVPLNTLTGGTDDQTLQEVLDSGNSATGVDITLDTDGFVYDSSEESIGIGIAPFTNKQLVVYDGTADAQQVIQTGSVTGGAWIEYKNADQNYRLGKWGNENFVLYDLTALDSLLLYNPTTDIFTTYKPHTFTDELESTGLTIDNTVISSFSPSGTSDYSFAGGSGTLGIYANDPLSNEVFDLQPTYLSVGADMDYYELRVQDTDAGTYSSFSWDRAFRFHEDGHIHVENGIKTLDDTDTYINMANTNQISLHAGNLGASNDAFLTIKKSVTDEVIVNQDGNDVDFRVESTASTHSLFVRGSDGSVGINDQDLESIFNVADSANPTITIRNTDATVSDNQDLGSLDFYSDDIGNAGVSARIMAEADGTDGDADLVFSTTAGGVLTEGYRLFSNGDFQVDGTTFYIDDSANEIGVGTSTPSATVDIVGDIEVNGDLEVTDGTRIFDIIQNVNGTNIGNTTSHSLNIKSNNVTKIEVTGEGRININDVLSLTPTGTAPNSGTEETGDIYLHDTGSAYELRVWNGSSWQTL